MQLQADSSEAVASKNNKAAHCGHVAASRIIYGFFLKESRSIYVDDATWEEPGDCSQGLAPISWDPKPWPIEQSVPAYMLAACTR